MVQVGSDDGPSACRAFTTTGGGRFVLGSDAEGAQVCVSTHSGRWALVRITGASGPDRPLRVHVVVLAR